jgi:DNA-binding NarL/FixJ family response regulator
VLEDLHWADEATLDVFTLLVRRAEATRALVVGTYRDDALEARPAAVIVARRLRDRGVTSVPRGPRSTTRQNQYRLTTREMEVLALVNEGLKNGRIADRLVVSVRTVDHLRKLGVKTRADARVTAKSLAIAVAAS